MLFLLTGVWLGMGGWTGCGGDEKGADSSDSAATDTEGGNTGNPAEAPTYEGCDAYCYQHTVGDTYFQWITLCTLDDPQGLESVDFDSTRYKVLKGSEEFGDFKFSCNKTTGSCTGSFKEADTDPVIYCDEATQFTFIFRATDYDGNTNTVELTGRQGP